MTVTEDRPPVAFKLEASEVPADLRETDSGADDIRPLICNFPGCVNGIVRTGKGGRPPRYCEEHKGVKRTTTAKSATSNKSWSEAVEVENLLNKYVVGLGTGIRLINPEDGRIIATGGPAVVHEIVELAKTDTKIREPLIWLTRPGKYSPLFIASLGLLLPILANHGLLPQFEIPNLTPGGDTE